MAVVKFRHPEQGENYVDTEVGRISHLRNRVKAWAIAMWELSKVRRVTFWGVMLTYRGQREIRRGEKFSPWSVNDINEYRRRVLDCYGGKVLGYLWVCERHVSGAIHYHVCWCLDASAGPMRFADEGVGGCMVGLVRGGCVLQVRPT